MASTNVALSAPNIHVIGGGNTINISGKDAPMRHQKSKANNASRKGENGDHGANGAAGQSAGHFSIDCERLAGRLLIVARGGNGSDGQDGGDGCPGTCGSDGKDGEIKDRPSAGWDFWNAAFRDRKNLKRFSKGSDGTAGRPGGSGGNAGAGGRGGSKGIVTVSIDHGRSNLKEDSRDGSDGRDGNPGKGAEGGGGGRNGRDRALVFVPKGCTGGRWVEDCGDLRVREKRYFNKKWIDHVTGYEIEKRSNDKGYASRGQHGFNGKRADQRQKQTATAKNRLRSVQHIWEEKQNHILSAQQVEKLTTEIVNKEAENNRIQSEIKLLNERMSAITSQELPHWRQEEEQTGQQKSAQISLERDLQNESSRLNFQKEQTNDKLAQQTDTLRRTQEEIDELKKAVEESENEIKQLKRSIVKSNVEAERDIETLQTRLSNARNERETAEKIAHGTWQQIEVIRSNRNKAERSMVHSRQKVDLYTKTMANNVNSIEENRQFRSETGQRHEELMGGLGQLSGKMSQEDLELQTGDAGHRQQRHRVERINDYVFCHDSLVLNEDHLNDNDYSNSIGKYKIV